MIKALSSVLLGLLLLAGISVDGVSAQSAVASVKSINGGVVNGKAVNLPKPEYPTELRDAGIEGIVAVNVVIDEAGNVISAAAEINDQRVRKDADGNVMEPAVLDPQLRTSAENAARGAKFAPTLLDGTAVSIKGKIVYNFSAKPSVAAGSSMPVPKTISGGVLNGKATSLPLPAYPPAAKAVRAEGAVSVQVLVDEAGNVISASAVSGHPLLRSAAETAALEAKFSPTMLSGTPVKISGVLTYVFVP
jgi:TonB family protein